MDKNAAEKGKIWRLLRLILPKINSQFQHISPRIVTASRNNERRFAALSKGRICGRSLKPARAPIPILLAETCGANRLLSWRWYNKGQRVAMDRWDGGPDRLRSLKNLASLWIYHRRSDEFCQPDAGRYLRAGNQLTSSFEEDNCGWDNKGSPSE